MLLISADSGLGHQIRGIRVDVKQGKVVAPDWEKKASRRNQNGMAEATALISIDWARAQDMGRSGG